MNKNNLKKKPHGEQKKDISDYNTQHIESLFLSLFTLNEVETGIKNLKEGSCGRDQLKS